MCTGSSSIKADPFRSLKLDVSSNDPSKLVKRLTALQSLERPAPFEPNPMSRFARMAVYQRLQDGLPMPAGWEERGIKSENLPNTPTSSEYDRCVTYTNANDPNRALTGRSPDGTPATLSFSSMDEPR